MKARVQYFLRLPAIAVLCMYASSCTKPGNVTLPQHEPKLVLHGYTAVGDTFKVALGKTLQTLVLMPVDSTYVLNGRAALYGNDVFLDSLRYNAQEKRYVSGFVIAKAGMVYKIRAAAPGYPDIEAIARAPFPVSTVSVVRKRYTRRDSGGAMLDDLVFSFNDPAAERNFYLTTIRSGYFGSVPCIYSYDPSVERYAFDALPFDQTDCIDGDEILYNDKTFNGSLKEITLSMDAVALDSFKDGAGNVFRSYIKRYNIAEEYYRYVKAAKGQILLEEGPSFADPAMIQGNVKNGYGLFTIFSVVTDTIR